MNTPNPSRRLLVRVALVAALLFAGGAMADGHHFLWRVSDGNHRLFLIGSVHVLTQNDYPLPAEMEEAFRTSGTLMEEVDPATLGDPDAQLEMLSKGRYADGQTLQTTLSADAYAHVSEEAHKLGLDMALLQPLKPWLASLTVLDLQLMQHGFDPELGVDMHFAEEASAAHKTVAGLETLSDQIDALDTLPDATQQAMLLQSLDEAGDLDGELRGLLQAWHSGDAAALEHILHDDFGGYPDVYQSLVVRRNHNWMPKLETCLKSGTTCLVVVGALHLVGPDGLLEQLKKAGYKVEQL